MDGLSGARRSIAKQVASQRGPRTSRVYHPAWAIERFEERTLLSVALVSVNAAGTGSGDGSSVFSDSGLNPTISTPGQASSAVSGDDKLMVFQSDATDLVAGLNDTDQATDVFVRNLQTGQTQLVSATPAGTTGNGRSYDPIISPNGQYVAFLSTATNLSSVTANAPDGSLGNAGALLYVRDLQTGTTTLLDATPDGQPSDGFDTGAFVFSPDSSALTFADTSTDLAAAPQGIPGSTGGGDSTQANIYLRNLAAGTTSVVSVTPSGALSQGSDISSGPSPFLLFSPDGTKLAFSSSATDLTDNQPDNSPAASTLDQAAPTSSLYVRDLTSNTTTLVSATPDGQVADGSVSTAVFSPDSQSLAFVSSATDLTAQAPAASSSASASSGGGPAENLFVQNLTTQVTTAVTVTPGNTLSAGTVSQVLYSPDGQSLAYVSTGTGLTANPVDPSTSNSTLLAVDPSAAYSYVYLSNLSTGATTAVSLTPSGDLAGGFSGGVMFSPDGQSLVYTSAATDLTANPVSPQASQSQADSSASTDPYPASVLSYNIYLTHLATNATTLVTVTPSGTLADGVPETYVFSPDGSQLAFEDTADDLTNNPPDPSAPAAAAINPADPASGSYNVFVRNLAAQSTTLVSETAAGTLAFDPNAGSPNDSPDAPGLFFSSDSQTLYFNSSDQIVAGDASGTDNIYAATAPYATPGDIHFNSWQYDADEPSGMAVITIVRNAPYDGAAAVNYAVQDGTAIAGTDYQATSGTLNFSAGQSSASFTIPLVATDSYTGVKTATITLSNPTGASLSDPTATLVLSGTHAIVPLPLATPAATPAVSLLQGPSVATLFSSLSPTPTPTSTTSTTGSHTLTAGSTTSSTATTIASNGAAVSSAGPVVSGVALLKKHGKISGVVVTFNEALASSNAGNMNNYAVNLLTLGRRTSHGMRPTRTGRAIKIVAEQLGPLDQTATLTLGTPLAANQMFQLTVNGGQGGITDTSGRPLNSPSKGTSGSNFTYIVNDRSA